MSRNFLIVMVCFVALKHKHVLGELVLRDISQIHKTVLQPLSIVLCPWKPLLAEEENSQSDEEPMDESRANWCGTTEEVGGFCNAKCSHNIIDGYLQCAKELKKNVKKFIDRVMNLLCNKKEEL